jgi:hypothetical protein
VRRSSIGELGRGGSNAGTGVLGAAIEGRIALVLVLLVLTGCGGTAEKGTGGPALTSQENECRGKTAPHTPAEVVAALRRHGITTAGSHLCAGGQRQVNGLFGNGLAGEENAVYCSVAAAPAAQRAARFKDQVRQGNVFCVTHSARVHKRVVAALRELPR